MSNRLLVSSLKRLRDQFDNGRNLYPGVECVLVEQSRASRKYPAGDPGFDKWWKHVTWRSTFIAYRDPDPGFVEGGGGLLVRCDHHGQRIMPRSIEERMRTEGSSRNVYLREESIDSQGGECFRQLAAAAGELLVDLPERTLIPLPTFDLQDAEQRWICALFDLAWAKVRGSPLRADRIIWFNRADPRGVFHCNVDLLPLIRSDTDRYLIAAETPDPPDRYYSVFGDVMLASSQAIDILLSTLPAAEQESDDAHAPASDFYQATWFKKATKGGLYADLLRIAWNTGRIKGQKRGKRNYYSLASVVAEYPQYRQALEVMQAKDLAA